MSFNDDYAQRRLLKRGKTLDDLESRGIYWKCKGRQRACVYYHMHVHPYIRLYYCSACAIDLSALITPARVSPALLLRVCKSNGACLLHGRPLARLRPRADREWELESTWNQSKIFDKPSTHSFCISTRNTPFSIVPHWCRLIKSHKHAERTTRRASKCLNFIQQRPQCKFSFCRGVCISLFLTAYMGSGK